MTGIHEVAQAAGLSTATVSRALRGLPGVSEFNRKHVLDVARELNYAPSRAAAVLASGQTRDIAVVVPFMTRWYFATVTDGAASVFNPSGYGMLLYHLAGDAQARSRILGGPALGKRVDGVLLLGLRPTDAEAELLRGSVPVSLVGSQVPGFPSVSIDDRNAARTGTDHLVALGHRRIGFIGGDALPGYDFSTPRDRRNGYREALTHAGIPIDPDLEVSGGFTLSGGAEALERLLRLPDPPTAVFSASDEMAIGALQAARQAGVRIPEDLSVVGVDDHEMAQYFELTTIRQPVNRQGQLAAQYLLDQLTGTAPAQPVILPTELIVRGTTSPPGG